MTYPPRVDASCRGPWGPVGANLLHMSGGFLVNTPEGIRVLKDIAERRGGSREGDAVET